MKKVFILGFIALSLCKSLSSSGVQYQTLPTAVSDDVELMFDETPDALDAITIKDCDNTLLQTSRNQEPTLLQSCYQTALLYLLSSYLSIKYSCESAKQYMASLLVWAPTFSGATFSAPVGE